MDDTKIKEEFEKSEQTDWQKATLFSLPYTQVAKGNRAIGFYAGFRAAERLAKIEVLEKLISDYGYDIGGKAITEINRQIKEAQGR